MNGRISFVIFLLLVPALAMLYYFADARYVSFFPQCPFHYLTGLFCPGCGSQRGLSALLHGQFWQAFQYNALMMASLPLLLYSGTISVANQLGRKKISQPLFYSTTFVRILLLLVLLFWLLRNINMYPFSLLAPKT